MARPSPLPHRLSPKLLNPTTDLRLLLLLDVLLRLVLIPETKGMSFERMDDLSGVTETAKALGDEETGHATGPPGKPVPQVQETTADAIEHKKSVNQGPTDLEHMEEVKL